MPLRAIYKPEPAFRRIPGLLLPYLATAALSAAATGGALKSSASAQQPAPMRIIWSNMVRF